MASILTLFDFGKYKGIPLWAVAVTHPTYIEWCIKNAEWFYVDDINELEAVPLVFDYKESPESLKLREQLKERIAKNPNLYQTGADGKTVAEYLKEKGYDFYEENYKPFLLTHHKFEKDILDTNEAHKEKERTKSKGRRFRGSDDSNYEISEKYDKYNGAYGFDDETIDNAFEGDPENYWNID